MTFRNIILMMVAWFVFSEVHAQTKIDINAASGRTYLFSGGVSAGDARNGTVRTRTFVPNPQLRNFSPDNEGDTLALDFFVDKRYKAVVKHVTEGYNGIIGITAHITGTEAGYCFIAASDDGISITAELPQKDEFFSNYAENGVNYLSEQKLSDVRSTEGICEEHFAEAPEKNIIRHKTVTPVSRKAVNTPTTIDLMIVYTPEANKFATNNGTAINLIIELAMARANEVLSNSQTNAVLRLVHSQEIDYREASSPNDDLRNITNSDDGIIDEVHLLRNRYRADLVCLLVAHTGSNVAGSGWVLKDDYFGSSDNGFSVVRVNNIAGGYTMIHEIGHNMGCGHHAETDNNALYGFSHGRRSTGSSGTRYSTVMAYERGNYYTTEPDVIYPRIPYFSNPDIKFEGLPIGTDNKEDNARTIRQTCEMISKYDTDFPNYDSFLKSLTVSRGILEPAFDPTVKDYRVTVKSSTASIDIDATAENPAAAIDGEGKGLLLAAGDNVFTITVNSDWGSNRRTYTITVVCRDLPAPPPVIFPASSPVTYRPDQTLGDIALQGGSGDGTFAWADPDIIPTVNNTGYEAVFTPRDMVNFDYGGVTLRKNISLTVNKAGQTITFPVIPEKTTADAPFNLNASVDTSLPLQYKSSDEAVAGVSLDGKVIIRNAGTTTITVYQQGNDNYLESRAGQPLTVIANEPDLPTPSPVIFPAASPVTYRTDQTLGDIALQGGSGDGTFAWADPEIIPTVNNTGYEVVFMPRDMVNFDYGGVALRKKISLTVNKAGQTITFPIIPEKTTADASFNLNASADTGLPLQYKSSDEAVAGVSPDGTVTIRSAGTTTITVYQQGNDNYFESRAGQLLTVAGVTGTEDVPAVGGSRYAYPNPVQHGEKLYVITGAGVLPRDAVAEMYHLSGQLIQRLPLNGAEGRRVSVQAPDLPGVYLLIIKSKDGIAASMKIIVI